MKTSKKELLSYATYVNAEYISKWSFEDIEALRKKEGGFTQVAYSMGLYGVSAYLCQGNETKTFYVVPCRCTALHQVM